MRQLLTTRGIHTVEELEERVKAYQTGRRAFEETAAWGASELTEVLPAPEGLVTRIANLEAQATERGWLDGLPHEVVVVSLGQLRAFQFTVDRPYANSFRTEAHASVETLGAITLPDQPPAFPLQVSGDGAGLTVSAPGPNLRVQAMSLEGQAGGRTRLTVDLTFGSPFVQVAEFQGTMLLKNGYHRAFSLIAQGVTYAPVLLVHCTNYAQTGAAGQGFFSGAVVMGEKPPLLKHFLSPFAIEFNAVDLHKAIRFRPDEFQLAVPE